MKENGSIKRVEKNGFVDIPKNIVNLFQINDETIVKCSFCDDEKRALITFQ